jgi:NAD(P)-dependent dehydrogenase (short-subunit alcohol dehydrogenase family)
MSEKILITGASGLLGRALVRLFLEKGYYVVGQYHKNKPAQPGDCEWLRADFSTLPGIREFLEDNRSRFKDCKYLINNYGPIIYKDIFMLKAEDFNHDFFHNVITAVEITNFFLKNSALESVVNIGFEFAGVIKPYKKILPYAAAKNSLLLITRSFAENYNHVRFKMVCLPTLKGAAVKLKKGKEVSPLQAAQEIYETLTNEKI